ncbi:MAG: helix-hairpin-helix domain-containing protein [bacterium]|nr:helix-hairpin-helix domain-containing protein [bacterium]
MARGIILIVVLWIMVILTVVAMSFSRSMVVEYRIAANGIDKLKTFEIAKSGIERAIAEVALDSTAIGTLTSRWRVNSDGFQNIVVGEGTYTLFFPDITSPEAKQGFGLTDENSKLNINSAPKEMLLRLPQADEIIADSIIDWRSATAKASPYGAKDEYYTQLNPPYKCKNGPFDTLEELLLVKGITPQILFGEDANLNGLLDANENDGDTNFPPDNADGKLDRGWYPYITIYSYDMNVALDGTQRININQASGSQLRQLTQYGLSNADIANIISYRRRNGFRSLGDLLNVTGINNQKFGAIVDYITVVEREKLPGLININTASKETLQFLPGITAEIAEKIIERRNGTSGAFKNLGELAETIGKTSFQQISDYVTVRSSQFTVQSLGRLTNKSGYTRLIAVIDRAVVPIRILYYRDISDLGPGI